MLADISDQADGRRQELDELIEEEQQNGDHKKRVARFGENNLSERQPERSPCGGITS
jgi:hypothetical protein